MPLKEHAVQSALSRKKPAAHWVAVVASVHAVALVSHAVHVPLVDVDPLFTVQVFVHAVALTSCAEVPAGHRV
jgi:hypothetical protein